MISLVIPAHNAARTLGECLRAIRCSNYTEYEIIVVDDASTDSTAQVAMQHACRVVRLSENVGAARAKNIGVSAAQGDIVLFTDADIVLQPDTLSLVAQDLSDPNVAGVVGLLGKKLRYNNFSSQFKNLWMYYTYRRLAALSERGRTAGDSPIRAVPRPAERDAGSPASRGVGVFFTSLAAIRKDVFMHMGGFDANYRGASVTEDIEFGQRLLSAGQMIRLDARLEVEHLKHYTLRGLLKTDLERAFGLSKTWLRKKLEPAQRATGQKYYASVPWFFVLGVPLAWLLPVCIILAVWTRQPQWVAAVLLDYLAISLLNAPFLNALRSARGWLFGLQSCLFLPIDLWVSGLGVLWALVDYLAGNRY